MMNRRSLAHLRPMILVFIMFNVLFIAGRNTLAKWGIDQTVVIVGNLIIFVDGVISFLLSYRSLKSQNPNVFVRAMYGSFMLKLFVGAAVVLIYVSMAKSATNKAGLFVCMGLYVIYTVLEVATLTKLLRQKKNA
jgi:hypothetical protein